MPESAQRSSTTPPCSGTLAPHTPLRPAAAVTGTPASSHTRSTSATSPADPGRATALARAATCPSSAQIIASGHQSRLASATAPASTVTSVHAERSRASSASSTGTVAVARWVRTSAGSAPNAIGGVGCPVTPLIALGLRPE